MFWLVLNLFLLALLVAVLPRWGYSSGWGYGPSAMLAVILVALLILLAMGRM